MKKGSKKHTVALSATSSIDKFPLKDEGVISSIPIELEYTGIEAGMSRLDENFNKKFSDFSSSLNSSSSNKANNLDTDIYKNFHEKMQTYPAYISIECATTLNVAYATDQSVTLDKLPVNDIEIINQQLDKLKPENIIRDTFTVKLDDTRDFELWFLTKKSSKLENAPITKQKLDDQINGLSCGKSTNRSISSDEIDDMITELEDDCDGVIDRKDETVKIRLFNTVIHPEPINTIGVPIAIDGNLLVEAKPIDVKVKNGTLEMNNTVKRFKYLAGISSKEELETSIMNESVKPHHQYKAELPVTEEYGKPVIIKNRNAFEIRLSLVDTATDIVKITMYGQVKTEEFVCEVLQVAKALYAFVENKNK